MNPLTWPSRLALAVVGFYIDRAVRRLHRLDSEEN